jgi:hypothetical protein
VPGHWSSLVVDTAPGVALLLIGLIAAAPAYALVRQSQRGRARSAIAYLTGFLSGLLATTVLLQLGNVLVEPDAIAGPGLFSSFFCPFLGIARAKWQGPRKRSQRGVRAGERAAHARGRLIAP